EVHVAHGERIRHDLGIRERHGCQECHAGLAKMNEGSMLLIDSDNIHDSIPIKVGGLGHSNGCIGWPKRNSFGEAAFAVVEIDIALATIAVGHEEIDKAIMV